MEQTFVILKPDCLQRGLAGEVLSRFEKKGLKIVAMKMVIATQKQAEFHYAEHKDKSFFGDLIGFITSGPIIVVVLEGENAIQLARKLAGKTNVLDAEPGTIRGDFVCRTNRNIVHTSDSVESANREISNFFAHNEILSYQRAIDSWL